MKFHKDNLIRLTAAVAKAISERRTEIIYGEDRHYVLDQNVLYEVIKEALENA